ncbi:hypothetical protein IFM47457_04203 [Aspergillus lentulus]|nr:hypothetical protein IFM47457_04203 [Aspergillus lentulus]
MTQDSLLLIDQNLECDNNVPLLPAMVDLSSWSRSRPQNGQRRDSERVESVKAWMPPGAVADNVIGG